MTWESHVGELGVQLCGGVGVLLLLPLCCLPIVALALKAALWCLHMLLLLQEQCCGCLAARPQTARVGNDFWQRSEVGA